MPSSITAHNATLQINDVGEYLSTVIHISSDCTPSEPVFSLPSEPVTFTVSYIHQSPSKSIYRTLKKIIYKSRRGSHGTARLRKKKYMYLYRGDEISARMASCRACGKSW